jgi:tetratricopeptide (TPR) repeat protein
LRALDEAEALLGPSPVLALERARHARALGLPEPTAPPPAPRTAWEHIAVGRAFDQAGRLAAAAEEFGRAVERDPHNFWAHFYQGRCAYRLGHPAEAVTAFSVCVALAPQAAACYYNRALAREAADSARAVADYTRALDLDPALTAAVRANLRRLLHHDPQLAAARALLDRLPPES